jgi:uncharacterized protein YbjT (DUF2867 family)
MATSVPSPVSRPVSRAAAAADAVEASGLGYTILWPAWLTNSDEVGYEASRERRTLQRTEVPRKAWLPSSPASPHPPACGRARIWGVNKPGTGGDKPGFL